MDVAALIVSIVAALFTGASVAVAWIARSDSKRAGGEAATAQERANAAAERATAAAERMAAIQAAIFDGPPWTMTWAKGDTYLLTNNSPVAAEDVQFETDPVDLQVLLDEEGPKAIGPRSAVTFMCAGPTFDDGLKRDAIIRWKRPGSNEELEWRHPLPLRPDR